MVRPEKGSLADRSDIKNKVRIFRKRTRLLNGPGRLEVEIDNDAIVEVPRNIETTRNIETIIEHPQSIDIIIEDDKNCDAIVQCPRSVDDRLSPQPFDVSFCSSNTENAARTSACKTSPASFMSSTSSTALTTPTSRQKLSQQLPATGRQWSPIAEFGRPADTSANGTSSLLFEYKSSTTSSPVFLNHSPNQSAYTNDENVCQNNNDSYKNVVLRRSQQNNWNNRSRANHKNDAGKPLKAALEKICRHNASTTLNGNSDNAKNCNTLSSVEESSAALDHYIGEVFRQLDHNRCGTVSREDFELLCEVLGISSSSPTGTAFRNSGIEWLSSYMPRPNSPVSPLRFDKLSDVKYKSQKTNSIATTPTAPDSRPHFLFTLGPRPFWEMWPLRRCKKKRLTIEDFKSLLLERWAKSRGRNSQLLAPNLSTISSALLHPRKYRRVRSTRLTPSPSSRPNTTATTDSAQSETRTRRIMKRMARAARRYLIIDKMSQRLRHLSGTSTTTSTSQRTRQENANTDGLDRIDSASIISNKDQQPDNLARSLEHQVLKQQTEIANLRSIIKDLRSSLQLSDAQNLALQVLLKKMAKTESTSHPSQQPSSPPQGHDDTFRSHTIESEEQLENLVRELKAMSQTKYPTTNTLLYQHQQHHQNGSSSCSFNGTLNNHDFSMEDEFQETSKALSVAQDELQATQQELQLALSRLKQKEDELQQSTIKMKRVFKALEKAQQEIQDMRLQLCDAQKSLSSTNEELQFTKREFFVAQTQLTHSDRMLLETELRLSLLSQSRQSLVLELQATRKLLASSLNLVHDLEAESKKVPILEKQIQELSQFI